MSSSSNIYSSRVFDENDCDDDDSAEKELLQGGSGGGEKTVRVRARVCSLRERGPSRRGDDGVISIRREPQQKPGPLLSNRKPSATRADYSSSSSVYTFIALGPIASGLAWALQFVPTDCLIIEIHPVTRCHNICVYFDVRPAQSGRGAAVDRSNGKTLYHILTATSD
ncbi:hypothetical protein QTP88_010180 [Uroleucon formosanum]